MLTVSKGAIFMFLSWNIGNSCSHPCLPDSPSSMASLVVSDMAGWDPRCGCPAHAYWPFIVWETVICTTLSQAATSFPMADLGSHCFSPAGFPEPQQPPGGLAQIRSSRFGITFSYHLSLLSLTPVLEIISFPSSQMMPIEPSRTGDNSWRRKKHSTRLYVLHTPLLEA